MSGADLLALAERCEAATGADRELDAEIRTAAGVHARFVYSRNYTASLDAAMTLVPEGWDHMEVYQPDRQTLGWTVHIKPNANIPRNCWTGFAQSYALALCAAALRARAGAA